MARSLWQRFTLLIVSIMLIGLLAPMAQAQETAVVGIDVEDMDLGVDPGEDFYTFVNGGWEEETEIPSTDPRYGVFDELFDRVTATLLEVLSDVEGEEGTDAWRVAQLHEQALDVEARAANGVEPIQPALDRIAAIASLEDAYAYHEVAMFDGVSGFFSIYGGPGFDDASINIAWLGGPTLSLPSREYYLDESEEMESIRQAWVETTATLLEFAGYAPADATAAAEAVLAFETEIATVMTPDEDRFDVQTYNNPRTIAELGELVPEMNWDAYAEALELTDIEPIYVDDIRYLEALAELTADLTDDELQAIFVTQLIWGASPYLSEEIGDAAFAFNGAVLSGVEERRPIEDRALFTVQDFLPDALGQLYVAAAFSPESKAAIEELVGNLVDAFRIRIENSTWMSEETKVKAIEKLDKMRVKVGYPDEWETYEDVAVGDSLLETVANSSNAAIRKNLSEIGQPVDKEAWVAAVFEVNAFYNPLGNEIVFPAAILQPPFFDAKADPATNYGAIGMVIGHEITHGFDLSGSQFDGDGNVASWWTEADRSAFQALNARVVEQFSAIEVLPELFVNGELTVGENVADMGGLQTAYDALQIALHQMTDAERAELPWFLTQDQRFFVSNATVWRQESREEFTRLIVASDEHTPSTIRAVQPLRNMDEFFEAFAIGPDDPMYLPPAERVVIW